MDSRYDVTTIENEFTTTNLTLDPYSKWTHVLSACYGVTSFLAGFGNLIILVIFATNRKMLDKNFNVLILNLTIADLAVGVLDLPWKASSCQITITVSS